MSAAPALRLDLRPSRRLAGLLLVVHGLALLAAWVSFDGWIRYSAMLAIAVSGACSLARVVRRGSRPAVSLEFHGDGRASWRNGRGGWHEGRLARGNFVSAALVVLGLEQAQRRRKWVVLMADSTSPEEFRRLRVWLRWRGTTTPAGSE
jgi:toxin CptA